MVRTDGPRRLHAEGDDRPDGDHDQQDCKRALTHQGLGGGVLGTIDAEEHDHEEEEDDDGAGVDDHLDGGEELRLLLDELDGDSEERQHHGDRRVDRVLRGDHADPADQDHQGPGDDHRGIRHGASNGSEEVD